MVGYCVLLLSFVVIFLVCPEILQRFFPRPFLHIFSKCLFASSTQFVCVCVWLDYSSWQTNEALLLGSSIQPKVFLRQMEARTDRRTPCLDYCCIELADIFPDAIYFCFLQLLLLVVALTISKCMLCFFLGRDDRPPSFLSLQLVQFSADVLLGMLIPPYICCCCCSCS